MGSTSGWGISSEALARQRELAEKRRMLEEPPNPPPAPPQPAPTMEYLEPYPEPLPLLGLPEPADTAEWSEKGGRSVDGYAVEDEQKMGLLEYLLASVLMLIPFLFGLIFGAWLWL